MNHDPIPAGKLERVVNSTTANRIRERTPFLTPICEHGRAVARCTADATVYRSGIDSYTCDVHAFAPEWAGLATDSGKHGLWRFLDSSRSIPESPEDYETGFVRDPESNIPVTNKEGYAHILYYEHDYELVTAYELARTEF